MYRNPIIIMAEPLLMTSFQIANEIEVPAIMSCRLLDVDLELKQCPA
jgi:hypothetical protein